MWLSPNPLKRRFLETDTHMLEEEDKVVTEDMEGTVRIHSIFEINWSNSNTDGSSAPH
jgi:hypothetical protein